MVCEEVEWFCAGFSDHAIADNREDLEISDT